MASITSGSDSEHLGIPKAVFVEDVDSFMQQPEMIRLIQLLRGTKFPNEIIFFDFIL